MRRGFLGGPEAADCEKDRLQNEFMEVEFSTETGAVMGVYSGSRGNRFSSRLVAVSRAKIVGNVEMKANRFQVTASSEHARSHRDCLGFCNEPSEEGSPELADPRMECSLTRGSRCLAK